MAQVDVIIPVYNTPIDFVQQALRSVVEQTFSDWKAIVINDGSTEPYTAELERLIGQLGDPRITYLRTENRGLPAARNSAIRASDSPYIALLDADDVWYPARLQAGVEVLQTQSWVDVVHANNDVCQPDSQLTPAKPRTVNPNSLSLQQQFARMLEGNYVCVLTALFRRTATDDAGLFDESFASLEDKEFWLRMMLHGKRFMFLDQVLGIYRLHASSMSRNVHKMAQGRTHLVDKLDRMLQERPLLDHQEWRCRRRNMIQHMYQEMAEEYLDKRCAWRALWYTLPFFSGLSGRNARLAVRCFYRAVALAYGSTRYYRVG
jgi:glycosyltransferase involved in cell wall biosynthesis